MVEPQTPVREVWGSKLTSAMLCPYSPKVLVIPRNRWIRPDMTEKTVDWDVEPQNKQKKCIITGYTVAYLADIEIQLKCKRIQGFSCLSEPGAGGP